MLEGGSGCAEVEGKEGSVSVTGTRGCCKDGQTQPDLRVLRPIAHYGDFGDDGRLRWGVGDEVVVVGAFTDVFTAAVQNRRGDDEQMESTKDWEATVLEFNAEGAAKIAFCEPVLGAPWVPKDQFYPWVPKDQFYRLFPLPNARDTPIQRLVKLARLQRCEVLALVLYTGVCVYLCGCVPRERMQSLSRPTTPCRCPSGQSTMMLRAHHCVILVH